MKHFLITIGVVGIIGVTLFLGVGLRVFDANADRFVFKQTATYNEGVTDDLAKYQYEYTQSKNDTDKKAIMQMVNNRFANYDESKIENHDLREFLEDCRKGELN